MIGLPAPIDAAVKWLQKFLRKESSGAHLAIGLAIAGHVIITLLLMLGAFERTEAAMVVSIPVEIVMEKPDTPAPPDQQALPNPQASPSPTASAPNEQNPWPSIPDVADVDKHAKAPLATLDVNGIDLPKQPGKDGGDPKRDMAGIPLPPADGEFASGADAASSWAMHVAPIGPAPPQTTAREPGEDDMTAIKEQKTQCGANAKWQSPAAGSRQPGRVIGIATEAQALALIRSSQLMTDRRINPKYASRRQVFAETLDGVNKSSVVLPPGITVNVGDLIEIDSGHVDPSDRCRYIPNIAVSKL
jgi:hypothetical protein